MRGKPAAPTAFIWATTAVGYGTQTCQANKYTMFGVSFAGLTAAETMTLGEVIKGDFAFGDVIMIPDATGAYTQYMYISAEVAEDEEIETGAGWYAGGEFMSDSVFLKNGESFWLFPSADISVTIAGQVKKTWTYDATANVYSMIANPFPASIKLGDFIYAGNFGDVIMIPDADGVYTQYMYISAEVAEDEEIETGAGWYCNGEFANNISIPANQGFWLLPVANVTISASLDI